MSDTGSGEGPINQAKESASRTDITIILDRSGSMDARREEVIRSFNDLLAEQRGAVGKAKMSLVQFDDEYEPVYRGIEVSEASPLTEETYQPRGTTALLDAVGRTIKETEQRLKRRAGKRREKGKKPLDPRVLVVVITDGLENASTDHTLQGVRQEIARQEADWNWSFVFLGAGLDAFAQAGDMGMAAGRSMRMGTGAGSLGRSMRAVSSKVACFRRMDADASVDALRESLDFTEEERADAEDRIGDRSGD